MPDPAKRLPTLRRSAASALVVGLALTAGVANPLSSALAQSGGDETFTTAATGLVAVGPSDLRWFAADVEVTEGDDVQDPAAGSPGFLLVDRGSLLVTADGGRRTLLDDGDALFVAADDQLQLQGVGDDATVWRIAVVADGDDPLSGGDGVGTTVEGTTAGASGAPDGALRKVSLRMGGIEDGDDPTAGGDDESVPLVVAMDGDLVLGDDDLSERGIAGDPEADRDGGVDIEADGDALAAYVAVGPALDPTDLTPGGSGADDKPADQPARPTPTRVSEAPPTDAQPDPAQPDPAQPDPNEPDPNEPDPAKPDPNEPDPNADEDVDGDGLTTADEALRGTDPDVSDTDNDGLTDFEEVFESGTDPLDDDSDDGGVKDGDEVNAGTNPSDGADDGGNGATDADGDGLTADQEIAAGTRADNPDSDGDGLTDGSEVNQIGTQPTLFDTDNDTIGDGDEITPPGGGFSTSPLSADTDGDGARDNADTFPNDPARTE